MQTRVFKDTCAVTGISTSTLSSKYADFIEAHKDFCIPYHPYKESVPTFEELSIECLALLVSECPKEIFDKVVDEVVRHPYTVNAMLALLAFPITVLDGMYHENVARVVQLVTRFCLCNGYNIYFNKHLVRTMKLKDLTDSKLKASVSFYQFA